MMNKRLTTKANVRKFFTGLHPCTGRLRWDQWHPERGGVVYAKVKTETDYSIHLTVQFSDNGIRVFAYLCPRSRPYFALKAFGSVRDGFQRIKCTWQEFNDDPEQCGHELGGLLSCQLETFADEMRNACNSF